MNQSSLKSGRSSGVSPARVLSKAAPIGRLGESGTYRASPPARSNENYLDALQALHTPSQPTQATWRLTGRRMETPSARGCVLARTYQEKAAPKRLRRTLPVGVRRVLGGAELLGRLKLGRLDGASLERVRREMSRLGTIKPSGKRTRILLAGLFGLGLSSGALASAALTDAQYQIQSADSLWAIARANNLSVDQLKTANGLQGDTIYAGEQLTIPASASSGASSEVTQQARVAQKAALLGRLNDLKQEREARQQARGLPSKTTPADNTALELASNMGSDSKTVSSTSSATQPVAEPEARTVEQQKLVNRLNQVISQDRRATQTVAPTIDSEAAVSTDSSSVNAPNTADSSTTDSSTDFSNAPQKNGTSLAEFKDKMQRTAALRAAKKAALLQRIEKDRAAVQVARQQQEQRQIKLAQAQLERLQKLAQAQQTRQIKLAQAQLERQQKRIEQAHIARVSTPRVDAPLVNTSRHQATVRSAAYRYVGLRYRMGGTGRGSIDCSAFTQATLRHLGYSIPRTARAQSGVGSRVSFRNLRAGDLVFFNTLGRGVSHAGVYLGGGMFANANSYRGRVVVESINARYWTSRFVTARRVLG